MSGHHIRSSALAPRQCPATDITSADRSLARTGCDEVLRGEEARAAVLAAERGEQITCSRCLAALAAAQARLDSRRSAEAR